jgi:hypothetical protein
LLTLTDQGMALLVKAFPIWQKTQKDLNALVANSDSRHLLTDLINLTNG